MTNEKKQICTDRRHLLARLVVGSAAGLALAACGGGGGDSSSKGSHDLRAALDRLQPGMNLEQIIAAVGWPPNDGGSADWDDGDEWLMVTYNYGVNGNPDSQITAALYHGPGGDIRRSYI